MGSAEIDDDGVGAVDDPAYVSGECSGGDGEGVEVVAVDGGTAVTLIGGVQRVGGLVVEGGESPFEGCLVDHHVV